jgi:hypothetical protein
MKREAALVVLTMVGGVWLSAQGQQPAINSQMRHATGQAVTPIFEGWFLGADGARYASYGYVNLNSEEKLDIPVGPDNIITPGDADRGQPTHFLPGHQKGVFTIPLVADAADAELTWSLTIRGHTMSVPTNLGPLYQIEGLVTNGGPWPGNTPPVLRFDPEGASGQGPAGLTMAVPVKSRPNTDVSLDVWITDDGLPGELAPLVVRSAQSGQRQRRRRQMSVAWSKYRGPGDVRFTEPSPPIAEDRARTTATFSEPGDYVLRVLGLDGSGLSGCCWTNGFVRVVVE